jgi:hypothetical protein
MAKNAHSYYKTTAIATLKTFHRFIKTLFPFILPALNVDLNRYLNVTKAEGVSLLHHDQPTNCSAKMANERI